VAANDEEIARLRRRLKDDPRSLAFVPLADLLRRAGKAAEALAVVRGGLRHHPEHVPARVVLARLHLESGQRPLAVAVLEESVEIDRENVAAGSLLAELMLMDGRIAEARALLERLLASSPLDAALLMLKSRATPQPRALHGDPRDPFDSSRWAERLAARGELRRAAVAWSRIADANPRDPGARARAEELAAEARRTEQSSSRIRPIRTEVPLEALLVPPRGESRLARWARSWWGNA
jgi:tetratricopeptide (TPR) repeat protein